MKIKKNSKINKKEILDINKSKQIFEKILDIDLGTNNDYAKENKNIIPLIESYISHNQSKITKYISLLSKNIWAKAHKQPPMFKLCLVFAYLPSTKDKYNQLGIDDNIFYDTMKDIKIWINDYYQSSAKVGLVELNWIENHLKVNIFQLGRLQIQLSKYYSIHSYKTAGKTIKYGDNILNVHIPRGGKMTLQDCIKSFEQSKHFFGKHFSDYDTSVFMCNSWLLHSSSKSYMQQNSNIIQFGQLFHIVEQKESPKQAFKWLFGIELDEKTLIKTRKKYGKYNAKLNLPISNNLTKNAVEYINNGGVLGSAIGIYVHNNLIDNNS